MDEDTYRRTGVSLDLAPITDPDTLRAEIAFVSSMLNEVLPPVLVFLPLVDELSRSSSVATGADASFIDRLVNFAVALADATAGIGSAEFVPLMESAMAEMGALVASSPRTQEDQS